MERNIYQHFRKSEESFIDLVYDWTETVENQYAPYLTEFLDPRQAFILETIIRQNDDLSYRFYGGYEDAERKRCLLYPSYFESTEEDFKVDAFEINYPVKFAQLSHGKILGTLLSTGLKREYFGDIITDGTRWQFFLAEEIQNYVRQQLTKIGSVGVRLEERNYMDIILPKDTWTFEHTTVSSLRLDTVISAVFNISRQRSKELIEQKKVKVNWTENDRPDFELELLDILSIRKFGRIQIRNIEGRTKKAKLRLEIGVLRK